MNIKKRIKTALNNDTGSLILEHIVLMATLLLISAVLLVLVFNFQEASTAKAGYSTTTGWFRTEDLNGIKH